MCLRVLPLMLILVVFAGCSMQGGDSHFAPPNLPSEYVQLEKQLNAIKDSGAQYTIAEAGNEKQSVQMIDLDADGENEAVAFFVTAQGVIRAYLFEYDSNGYYEVGYIEGTSARRLYSVSYPVYDQSGKRAIALSWTYDATENRGLSVSRYDGSELNTMLLTQYTGILYSDADGNGELEIFTTVKNDVTGAHNACVFTLKDNAYEQTAEVPMCLEARSVLSLSVGQNAEGENLFYVDSAAYGGGYVTDVIGWQGKKENLSVDVFNGLGGGTWRQTAVFCGDIDGDGTVDVPVASKNAGRISWYQFGTNGFAPISETYYSIADSWYMMWPSKWEDNVAYQRTANDDVIMTTFYVPVTAGSLGEIRNALLTVYVFSGDNSSQTLQSYSGVRVLKTLGSTIYGYSLMPNDFPEYSLSDKEISELINVIEATQFKEGY